jgi:hypothetical protein
MKSRLKKHVKGNTMIRTWHLLCTGTLILSGWAVPGHAQKLENANLTARISSPRLKLVVVKTLPYAVINPSRITKRFLDPAARMRILSGKDFSSFPH